MAEASTLVVKYALEIAREHPGMSSSAIAEQIDTLYPDLVDDLFRDRRHFFLRWFITDSAIGADRRNTRDKLRSGEIMSALAPDGSMALRNFGEMTGTQHVEYGERLKSSARRLDGLGDAHIKIGKHCGRRKVKNVMTDEELLAAFRPFYDTDLEEEE